MRSIVESGNGRRPPCAPSLGIVRLDQRFELRPRHHRRHLGEEHVPLRPLLLRREIERRKAQLVRHQRPLESMTSVCHVREVVQRFPSFPRATSVMTQTWSTFHAKGSGLVLVSAIKRLRATRRYGTKGALLRLQPLNLGAGILFSHGNSRACSSSKLVSIPLPSPR